MPLCCGGVGAPREPSVEEKQKLKTLLENNLEAHIGRKPPVCDIVQVSSQVVAGTNYFVKVHVGDDEYVHARIFEPLPCHGKELQLHSVLKDKKKNDALEYF
ncbi:Cystatin-B [Schistosoma japonicum]|uniref:Cystatin-B n=1 Tax=Schistosoma japonicum TaxID=6182 RepID=F0UXG3_SCHJA|nr:cysteine protease inhibitor [Schistosoma japonicum]ACU68954.1 cysteine protease inhibitor [Schistosoma japonicum]KAH8858565.1 Cystatin-B [Schistosoma japonicum]TNN16774.1 Cystatin-B [Schistosoma japonicum]CAX73577.1 Cystatin-B (Stefin-B) [Schistosoma japonicum]